MNSIQDVSTLLPLEALEDPQTEPLVEVSRLGKIYGKHQALEDLSLELYGGETLALLGHNGAGKTTLIKLLCGLIEPSSGSISYHFSGDQNWRYQLGYLPENIAFNQYSSGLELLKFFAKLKNIDISTCTDLFDLVGLSRGDQQRAVREYSKGMRQRLGLAQALLGQPRLLLLDEPTSGLDPSVRRDIYEILDECKRQGCALLISSHSLDEIENHCEKVTMLRNGCLVAQGDRQQLLASAQLPIVVQVQCTSTQLLKQQLNHGSIELQVETYSNKQLLIRCHSSSKLNLLQRLAQIDFIEDIRVQEPGLTQLYSHFCEGE